MTQPKHADVTVQLTGEDSNIFWIMGEVTRALRKAGVSHEECADFRDAVMGRESYEGALAEVMGWVSVR